MNTPKEFFAGYGVFFSKEFRGKLLDEKVEIPPLLVPGYELRVAGSTIFPPKLAEILGPEFGIWACYPKESATLEVLPIELTPLRKAMLFELNFDDLAFDYDELEVEIENAPARLLLGRLREDVGRPVSPDQFAPFLMKNLQDPATARFYAVADELRTKYLASATLIGGSDE